MSAFAVVAAKGNIYSGLWYPIVFVATSFVVDLIVLPRGPGSDISQILQIEGAAHSCSSLHFAALRPPQGFFYDDGRLLPKSRMACGRPATLIALGFEPG